MEATLNFYDTFSWDLVSFLQPCLPCAVVAWWLVSHNCLPPHTQLWQTVENNETTITDVMNSVVSLVGSASPRFKDSAMVRKLSYVEEESTSDDELLTLELKTENVPSRMGGQVQDLSPRARVGTAQCLVSLDALSPRPLSPSPLDVNSPSPTSTPLVLGSPAPADFMACSPTPPKAETTLLSRRLLAE